MSGIEKESFISKFKIAKFLRTSPKHEQMEDLTKVK
jgi:hypothetical protein